MIFSSLFLIVQEANAKDTTDGTSKAGEVRSSIEQNGILQEAETTDEKEKTPEIKEDKPENTQVESEEAPAADPGFDDVDAQPILSMEFFNQQNT